MSRVSASPGESDPLLEFLSEAQLCAIERDDTLNTSVGIGQTADLQAFTSECDPGTEPHVNFVTKHHEASGAGEIDPVLVFPSERSEGCSEPDDRAKVPAGFALNAEPSSMFVIERRLEPCRLSKVPAASTRTLSAGAGQCQAAASGIVSFVRLLRERGGVVTATVWRGGRGAIIAGAQSVSKGRHACSLARMSAEQRCRAWCSGAWLRAKRLQERSLSRLPTVASACRRIALAGGRFTLRLCRVGTVVPFGILLFLLTRWPPNVAMLTGNVTSVLVEPPLPPVKASAPIPPPEPLPAKTSLTVPVEQTTATRSIGEVRSTALTVAFPLPVVSARAVTMSGPRGVETKVPSRSPRPMPPPATVSPFLGSLAVNSSPEGAQVFVNGVSVGTTPLLLQDLPVGSRAVRVEREGHERWSSTVRIIADERTVVTVELQPKGG